MNQAENDILSRNGPKIGNTVQQMVWSFLKVDKSHEPEFMAIHRHDMNILLRWILFHDNRVHILYSPQRYCYLQIIPHAIIEQITKSYGHIFKQY